MTEGSILITGCAGFIGAHTARHFVRKFPNARIIGLDALTYAGHVGNMADFMNEPNFKFVNVDIADFISVADVFKRLRPDHVIHLAAESHVDQSIADPLRFVRTNVMGTANLLECARQAWEPDQAHHRFYHISTDEVYGALPETGQFSLETPYAPRSPYSASKAGSDHLVRSYHHTFGMNVVISNCSNNYGPAQFPEKLIPVIINNLKYERPLPIYGRGRQVRDWLHVLDHVAAIDLIFHRGQPGTTYLIGSDNEWNNLALVRQLCGIADELLQRPAGSSEKLISFVTDRPGHDFRYAIDNRFLRDSLGWEATIDFSTGLRQTFEWYLRNEDWLNAIAEGTHNQLGKY